VLREMRDGPLSAPAAPCAAASRGGQHAFCVFFEREFTFALRERCEDPNCTLQRVETGTPRIATNLVELSVDIYPGAARDGVGPAGVAAAGEPNRSGSGPAVPPRAGSSSRPTITGHTERIGPYCWSLIAADLTLFAGRAGATSKTLDLGLPAPPAETLDAPTVLRAVA
jgi:hypothetical protein